MVSSWAVIIPSSFAHALRLLLAFSSGADDHADCVRHQLVADGQLSDLWKMHIQHRLVMQAGRLSSNGERLQQIDDVHAEHLC